MARYIQDTIDGDGSSGPFSAARPPAGTSHGRQGARQGRHTRSRVTVYTRTRVPLQRTSVCTYTYVYGHVIAMYVANKGRAGRRTLDV
jgi:hypothetical protein